MRHHTGLWQSYSEVYRAGEEAVGRSVDTVFTCRCDLGNVGKREGLCGGGASRVDGVGKAEPICGNSHRVAGELEDDGGLGGWRGRSHALDGSADGGLSLIEAAVPAVLAEYMWLPTMWKCPQK